jgi:hypothetical protein
MVILEALNALYGDCLLLRYPGPDQEERLWIIDGGPRAGSDGDETIAVWKDVLLSRLKQISSAVPVPVALGMVSHIDDDHIFGIQKLTSTLVAASPARPAAVKFARFWFNSFDKIVGPKPAGLPQEVATASMESLVSTENLPGVKDVHAQMIMQSVGQGNALASDLRSLQLQGNSPFGDLVVAKPGQRKVEIDGARITVIGPLQRRLDALRKEWAKALKKPAKERQAALQDLFLPAKFMDKSIPNLSSIVVLVQIARKKLLLTGDAHGDDIVKAWSELELGKTPVRLNVLKMPHHGSIRNCSKKFLETFVADHYVFSANGKHDNPDAPTLEALVKMHGDRKITMHFSNEDVTWSKPYKLEKDKTKVRNLRAMLDALREAYPGPWKANLRKEEDKSVLVQLA